LLTATQNTGGGTNGAVTCTVAVALLLPVFVSGLLPLTVTVFVCAPAALGVVTSVIVTDSPAAIVPMVQLRIGPPVQVPLLGVADTNAFPAGI
jgi:hypothetical protein